MMEIAISTFFLFLQIYPGFYCIIKMLYDIIMHHMKKTVWAVSWRFPIPYHRKVLQRRRQDYGKTYHNG